MALGLCTQCGTPLLSGRPFCMQCGHRVAHPSPQTGPATPLSGPGRKFCTQCGQPVVGSKRFCPGCGAAVAAASAAQPVALKPPIVPEPFIPVAPALADSPASSAPPRPTVAAVLPEFPASEPRPSGATPQSGEGPLAVPAIPLPLAPITQQHPELRAIPPASPATFVVTGQTSRKSRLPIVLSAVTLVLIAVGSTTWLLRDRLGLTQLFHSATARQASAAPPQESATAQPSPAVTPPQPAPTPIAATAPGENPPVVAQPNPPAALQSPPPVNSAVPSEPYPSAPPHPTRVPTPTPTRAAAAEPPPVPPPARSGMLHYAGPPVPYNGVVVFPGLPAGRLRFLFDHRSWQPTISRRPDGTQTLTLRSLTPGEQTQCDVQWEVIQ